MHENSKKTGEIIFSVTQNRTCELPQFVRDFDDYAIMWIENYTILLQNRDFVECTINKKSHDLLVQFGNNINHELCSRLSDFLFK